MGEMIDEFPAGNAQQRRYPWHDWCNGKKWKLERGVDFDVEVEQFRNRLHTKAYRDQTSVHTEKLDEDGREFVCLQFTIRDERV